MCQLRYFWNTSSLDLAWHSPKLLGYQCWYHLSRFKQAPIQQLVPHFPHVTRKGISALVSCSFALVSYVQPNHYAISKFLAFFPFPIAISNQMVSENNLFFFSPSNLLLCFPQEQIPDVSGMAVNQMLLLPLSVSPPDF